MGIRVLPPIPHCLNVLLFLHFETLGAPLFFFCHFVFYMISHHASIPSIYGRNHVILHPISGMALDLNLFLISCYMFHSNTPGTFLEREIITEKYVQKVFILVPPPFFFFCPFDFWMMTREYLNLSFWNYCYTLGGFLLFFYILMLWGSRKNKFDIRVG